MATMRPQSSKILDAMDLQADRASGVVPVTADANKVFAQVVKLAMIQNNEVFYVILVFKQAAMFVVATLDTFVSAQNVCDRVTGLLVFVFSLVIILAAISVAVGEFMLQLCGMGWNVAQDHEGQREGKMIRCCGPRKNTRKEVNYVCFGYSFLYILFFILVILEFVATLYSYLECDDDELAAVLLSFSASSCLIIMYLLCKIVAKGLIYNAHVNSEAFGKDSAV